MSVWPQDGDVGNSRHHRLGPNAHRWLCPPIPILALIGEWAYYPQMPLDAMTRMGKSWGIGAQWDEEQLQGRCLGSREISEGKGMLKPLVAPIPPGVWQNAKVSKGAGRWLPLSERATLLLGHVCKGDSLIPQEDTAAPLQRSPLNAMVFVPPFPGRGQNAEDRY